MVVKRSGQREPFDRAKIVAGVAAAAKNRPVSADGHGGVGRRRRGGAAPGRPRGQLPAGRRWRCSIGLRSFDEVTYLRFASVYKGFSGAVDFEREAVLLTKDTEPKRHRATGCNGSGAGRR